MLNFRSLVLRGIKLLIHYQLAHNHPDWLPPPNADAQNWMQDIDAYESREHPDVTRYRR